jgi:hypothetical protein
MPIDWLKLDGGPATWDMSGAGKFTATHAVVKASTFNGKPSPPAWSVDKAKCRRSAA